MDGIEKLDLLNVSEVGQIRDILMDYPDLLSMFDLLVVMGNNRINEEKVCAGMAIEKHSSPKLESDSDEDGS